MKKIISLFLFLFVAWSPMAMADEYYDMGANIGSGLGSAMGAAAARRAYLKGDVTRKVWSDKSYDFSKMQKFLVAVNIVGNMLDVQNDNNMRYMHGEILKRGMQKKYNITTLPDVGNLVTSRFPLLKQGSLEYQKKAIDIISSMDALIAINIYTFNVQNGMTNVSYEIVVSPIKMLTKNVFIYKESRFNVPYKSGYQLFGEIVEKLLPKFGKCFKSKNSEDD